MSVRARNFIYAICPRTLKPYFLRVEASQLGARAARGIFWSISGALVSRGLMLLASIFVARILGRLTYGEFGMIRSTVNMFVIFAGFGLGLTATKHVAEFRYADPIRAGRVLAISGLFASFTGIVVAVGVFISSHWLATETINAPHLSGELKIGAIILFLNALNGAQTGALAGFEAFRVIAKVNLWVGISSFPLMIGGAYWGGLRGSLWALAASVAINWLLNHLALRREAARFQVPFTVKGCISEWPTLWKFSLPAVLGGVMVSPVMWACNAMLVNQPDGYAQMGLYDVSNQWRTAILFIPGAVGQIVLPMLSDLNGTGDQRGYRNIIKVNTLFNGGVAFIAALPIIVLSPLIMKSYGNGFDEGTLALVLFSVSSILISINNVFGQAIASKGHMWTGLFFNVLWALVFLAFSYCFIIIGYGVVGIAIATLIAYTLHSVWQFVYVYAVSRR